MKGKSSLSFYTKILLIIVLLGLGIFVYINMTDLGILIDKGECLYNVSTNLAESIVKAIAMIITCILIFYFCK